MGVWRRYSFGLLGLLLLVAGCASGPSQPRSSGTGAGSQAHYKVGRPYQIKGRWYHPAEDPDYDRTGVASWYGDDFHGRPTANGEIFDMRTMTAAHTTLPLPSMVEVTNLENGKRTVVRVNDRGPFAHDRIIDLSRAAARKLGFEQNGLAKVRVRYLGPAALPGKGTPQRVVRRKTPEKKRTTSPVRPAAAPPVAPTPSPARTPEQRDIAELITQAGVDREPVLPEPEAELIYIIEVATMSDLNRLPLLRARLINEGPLSIVRDSADTAPARYIINLGPFTDEQDAYERLEAVREAGYGNAKIVAKTP